MGPRVLQLQGAFLQRPSVSRARCHIKHSVRLQDAFWNTSRLQPFHAPALVLCPVRSSATASERRETFAPAAIVGRKLLFTLMGFFVLVLIECVPLCAVDMQALPPRVAQVLAFTSSASEMAQPILHPFVLGIIPFVEAQIVISFCSLFNVFTKIPLPTQFRLNREELQTTYGRSFISGFTAVLGSIFAFIMAAAGVSSLISHGVIGHKERWGISMAIVAGSAMLHMFSDMLTKFGLVHGISFIYLINITSRMQLRWVSAMTSLTAAHVAQCMAVVLSLAGCCVVVNQLRHFIPLVSTHLNPKHTSALDKPRLPLILCPNSTMVFIAAYFIAQFCGSSPSVPVNTIMAVVILAGNLFDVIPTCTMLATSLQDMHLAVPGVPEGDETTQFLIYTVLVLRSLGAVALFALFAASNWADAFLSALAGVQLSVIEIFILVSTITASQRIVDRAIKESQTLINMKRQFGSMLNV